MLLGVNLECCVAMQDDRRELKVLQARKKAEKALQVNPSQLFVSVTVQLLHI